MSTESDLPGEGSQARSYKTDGRSTKAARHDHDSRAINPYLGKVFSWESSGRWLLIFIVLLAPWLRGSVSAWAQSLACLGLGISFLCYLASVRRSNPIFRTHSILTLVLLFLVLGILQQLDLPDFLANNLSTKQLEIRDSLAGHLETHHQTLAQELRSQKQVVLNPSAGAVKFAYFGLLACAFFLATRFFYRRDDFLKLAMTIGFSGFVIAVFGIFQKAASPNQIFGSTLEFGGQPFGPFVNRNNASGYLLMCLSGAFSMLVCSYSGLENRAEAEAQQNGNSRGWLSLAWADTRVIIAGLDAKRIGMLAVCGCIVAGIAISLSRGGIIALAIGLAVLLVFLLRTGSRRIAILLLLLFVPACFTALLVTGEQESVAARLETLSDNEITARELRPLLWRDSLRSLADYKLLGSGIGSFPYVYKEYQTFPDNSWSFHAENIFVEIVVTFGVAGGLILVLGLGYCFYLVVYFVGPVCRDERSVAIRAMMLLMLVTQCVSNFFDFGLLVPANGLLFAVCFGGLTGLWGTKISREKRFLPRPLSRLPRWASIPLWALFLVLALANACLLWEASYAESARRASRTNDVEKLSLEKIETLIRQQENVLGKRPDLQTHEYLARLYLLRLQQQFVDFQMANLPEGIQVDRQRLWNQSSLRLINFRLGQMGKKQAATEIHRWMGTAFFKSNVRQATIQFEKALIACPLSVRSIIGLAELSYLNEVEIDGYLSAFSERNVKRPDFLRRMGDVAIAHGKKSIGVRYWRLAIETSESAAMGIIKTAMSFLPRDQPFVEKRLGLLNEDDIIYTLLPDNPGLIKSTADRFFAGPENSAAQKKLMERIKGLLVAEDYLNASDTYLLYQVSLETGDTKKGIESLEAATMLSPFKILWKYELAELYAKVKDFDKAIGEMEKCVEMEPSNPEYRQRLLELRHH